MQRPGAVWRLGLTRFPRGSTGHVKGSYLCGVIQTLSPELAQLRRLHFRTSGEMWGKIDYA
eukprot:scaffold302_cov247-Pinguiococcus_pyrenoidosus.AAC.24